ncbi:MAG: hypothetical protein Q8N51_05535 [Gammaproteobacteria bacterium]|nr:hypothetical protein [Gammaproteobacteria bacterium]
MSGRSIHTDRYTLFPSPKNVHREIFEHQVFVPHPYDLIDLPCFYLKGKYSLFAAHRLSDRKMGQLVTFELATDVAKFEAEFVPD